MSRQWTGAGSLFLLALAVFGQASSNWSLSYSLQSNPSLVPLQPGGAIAFAGTPVNTTAQALLNVSNRGITSGIVNSVTISGAAFRFASLPLFPVTVPAGQTLQLLIYYQPTTLGAGTGEIQLSLDGNSVTVGLQGSSAGVQFVYELISGDQTTPITSGSTVSLPDTNLGESSTITIRVRNAGNLTGSVTSLGLSGQDFQPAGTTLLPQVLPPNASFTFGITFTPTQPAERKGNLFINGEPFNLVALGLGPRLAFSFVAGGTTVKLGAGQAVVFSPVTIGQKGQLDFVLTNTGTSAATVFNIGIGEANSPFSITGLPPLPLHIDPGATATFKMNFTPKTTSFSNGTLRIDNSTVGLIGSGVAPPPLPAFSFSESNGNVEPMSQPAIGLKFASPYSIPIAGTLTLTLTGGLPSDPAVQFATGGRTVPFLIPANSTAALFNGEDPQIRLQTGTVAATISVTPTFTTETGGVDLTPDDPAPLRFTVPAAAPTLTSVQAASQTSSGFVLNVTGFSTTRSLNSVTVKFTAARGFSLPDTPIAIDLHQAAGLWFQTDTSEAYGGQFTVAIPFILRGKVSSGHNLIESIGSVSATVSNDQGASNTVETILN
jgi:hypothetical protein